MLFSYSDYSFSWWIWALAKCLLPSGLPMTVSLLLLSDNSMCEAEWCRHVLFNPFFHLLCGLEWIFPEQYHCRNTVSFWHSCLCPQTNFLIMNQQASSLLDAINPESLVAKKQKIGGRTAGLSSPGVTGQAPGRWGDVYESLQAWRQGNELTKSYKYYGWSAATSTTTLK